MVHSLMRFLATGLKWTCVGLVLIILVAMTAQVIFRYVFNVQVPHSDEIAQASLTWLTFLGSAWAYYEMAHIEVDLISHIHNPTFQKWRAVFVHLVVGLCMVFLIMQIMNLAPLMTRLSVGTLQASRFALHFLPLLLASIFITIFAIHGIWSTLTDRGSTIDKAT